MPRSRLAHVAVLAAALAAACRTSAPSPGAAPSQAAPASGGVPAAAQATPALPPLDESALDRSVAPCDDFYRFACGGWLAKAEIPPDRSAWSRGFYSVRERVVEQLRAILDDMRAGRVDPQVRFAGKVRDYYASCMDEGAAEAHGLDDLRAEWARVDAVSDRDGLAAELGRQAAHGEEVPFLVTSDQDAKDATQVIAIFEQAGLGLPDRDYYLSDDPRMAAIRALYDAHLRRLLALAGVPPADAEGMARGVLEVERALAETHWTRVEMREPSRVYNRVDRAGLERLAPQLPWARFFDALGHAPRAISVTTPPNVERVGRLFADLPLATWKAYLKWHLLADLASARALPKALVDERFAFTSKALTGAKELAPRWKKCVEETDGALGEALGQAWVRARFGAASKDRTGRLVVEIERAMERDLEGVPWMDPPTRARAREKLAKVANHVGYPDAWRDYSDLHVAADSYFQNVLEAARFEVSRKLDQVGKPVDRGEWLMSPPTVNAYYEASKNEMVFPGGILQPPYFNPAAPETVNYGAIGMVVGHELTHGFDDRGRQYDADGNLADWWTPDVGKEFDARAGCLVAQYSGYETIPGVKLNGKLTLGENIADLGGLKLALAAMRAARRGAPGAEEKVLGFSPDQQFFVGMAQSWCAKFRDEEARRRAVTDPHSPPRWRVNGTVANLPDFAEAFACEPGSAMARGAARCEVW